MAAVRLGYASTDRQAQQPEAADEKHAKHLDALAGSNCDQPDCQNDKPVGRPHAPR
jgi:hypothetical protein